MLFRYRWVLLGMWLVFSASVVAADLTNGKGMTPVSLSEASQVVAGAPTSSVACPQVYAQLERNPTGCGGCYPPWYVPCVLKPQAFDTGQRGASEIDPWYCFEIINNNWYWCGYNAEAVASCQRRGGTTK